MGAETTGGVCHGNEVASPFAFIGLAKEQKKKKHSIFLSIHQQILFLLTTHLYVISRYFQFIFQKKECYK